METSTYTLEESPSNRAICKTCNRKIRIGELRMSYMLNDRFASRGFICSNCSIKILGKDLKMMQIMIERLLAFKRGQGVIV